MFLIKAKRHSTLSLSNLLLHNMPLPTTHNTIAETAHLPINAIVNPTSQALYAHSNNNDKNSFLSRRDRRQALSHVLKARNWISHQSKHLAYLARSKLRLVEIPILHQTWQPNTNQPSPSKKKQQTESLNVIHPQGPFTLRTSRNTYACLATDQCTSCHQKEASNCMLRNPPPRKPRTLETSSSRDGISSPQLSAWYRPAYLLQGPNQISRIRPSKTRQGRYL